MSVIMAPGWYDQIAPYVQQLSGIIPRLINPNLDAQKQLQQRIIQNPEILQQLADFNANNPGAIDKLGFGNVSGYFGKIPESLESKTKKETAQAIANLTPAQRAQRVANLAGVLSDEEMEIQGLNKQRLTQALAQGEQELDEGERKRLELERIRGIEKQFDEWTKQRPGKTNLYAARRDNEIPEWMVGAITESPKISKQYDQDAQDYFREKNLEMERQRLAIARQGSRMGIEEWKQRSLHDTAERYAYAAGSTDVEGFKTLISNGQLQTYFDKLSPEQLQAVAGQSPQLTGAVNAYSSLKQLNEKKKQGIHDDLRVAFQQARIAADRFRQGQSSELEVKSAIENYNQRVAAARPAGINAGILDWRADPTARRDRFGPFTGDKPDERPTLMVIDPTNNSVQNAAKGFELPKPVESEEFKSYLDEVSKDLLTKSPEERKKVIQDLANGPSPSGRVAASELSKRFGNSQEIKQPTKPPEVKPKTPAKPDSTEEQKVKALPKGKKSSSELAQLMNQYQRTKVKSEKDNYLREWESTLDPADFARLKKMIGVK